MEISLYQGERQGTVKSEDVKITAQPSAELSPITGDESKDKYYTEKNIRQADGTYLFKEDTALQMTDGQPMVSSEKPVVIKAEGKKLSLTSVGDRNGTVFTVQQNSKDNLSITAKELAVKQKIRAAVPKVSTSKTEISKTPTKQISPGT